MDMIRRTVSWLCLFLISFLFFLTAVILATFSLINATNVQKTLRQENAYQTIVPSFLSAASRGQSPNQAIENEIVDKETAAQLPLGEKWVQDVATDAFPARDLEQMGEKVLAGTFNWLEGKTEAPEFRLDLTENREKFIAGIGSSVESRLQNLPRCAPGEIPSSLNAFQAKCLPFGVSATAVANQVETDLRNDNGFLKDPVIEGRELPFAQSSSASQADDTLTGLEKKPNPLKAIYENKSLLKWLLPTLTLLAAAIGMLLSTDRRKGLLRLARSFLSAGVGLLILGVLIGFGLKSAVQSIARDEFSKDIAVPLVASLADQFRTLYLLAAALAFALAIILYLAQRKIFAGKAES